MFIEHHTTTTIFHEKRAPKTLQAYSVRYNAVSEYLLSKRRIKLKCMNFDTKLAKDFFRYLAGKHSNNYAVRNVELCRAVLEFAAANDIIKYNPLAAFKLKKTGPDKPTYLTVDEVASLDSYKTKSTMHAKARDMFLFQVYTGLDYGDLVSITSKDIHTYRDVSFIMKPRRKTGVEACAPLDTRAKALLEHYNGSMNLLSNCKYNQSLKSISAALRITKRLTSHVGRKTYAMGKLNEDAYSIEAVSKMIGHKSIKTTETYYAQVGIDLVLREHHKVMQRSTAA